MYLVLLLETTFTLNQLPITELFLTHILCTSGHDFIDFYKQIIIITDKYIKKIHTLLIC